MRHFDLTSHVASQVSSLVYSIAPVAGFKELPENVDHCSVMMRDASGNSCGCWGVRTGNSFTIQVVRSSSAGLSPPAFSSSIKMFSEHLAADIQLSNGLNGVWINGDSLAVGYTEGGRESDDGVNDWVDPSILMRGHTPAVSGDDSPMYTVLREPVRHALRNEAVNDLGVAIPLSHGLKTLGINNLCILGNGQSSVGFSAYGSSNGATAVDAPSGGNMNRAIVQGTDLLTDSPRNSMLCGVFFVGTNDTNYNAYQGYLDRLIWMATQYRERLTTSTGVDHSRLPLIFVGQCAEMLADPATAAANAGGLFNYDGAPTREQALADLPNFAPYTAYVNTTGLASHGDMFHYNAESYRILGTERIPIAYFEALANHNPPGLGLNLTATEANVAVSDTDATIQTNEPIELNATSPTAAIEAPNAELSSGEQLDLDSSTSASATASVSAGAQLETTEGSPTETLDANNFDIELLPNTGMTIVDTDKVSAWQSQGSNALTFPQTVAARRPTLAAGGGIDCTGSKRLYLPSGFGMLKDTTAGSTIIIAFVPTSTTGYIAGTTDNRIGAGAGGFFGAFKMWQGAERGDNGSWMNLGVMNTLVITIDSTSGIRHDANGVTIYENAAANPTDTAADHFTVGGWETQDYLEGVIHAMVIKDGSGYMDKATTDAIAAELAAL